MRYASAASAGCASMRPLIVERLARGAVLTATLWESVLPGRRGFQRGGEADASRIWRQRPTIPRRSRLSRAASSRRRASCEWRRGRRPSSACGGVGPSRLRGFPDAAVSSVPQMERRSDERGSTRPQARASSSKIANSRAVRKISLWERARGARSRESPPGPIWTTSSVSLGPRRRRARTRALSSAAAKGLLQVVARHRRPGPVTRSSTSALAVSIRTGSRPPRDASSGRARCRIRREASSRARHRRNDPSRSAVSASERVATARVVAPPCTQRRLQRKERTSTRCPRRPKSSSLALTAAISPVGPSVQVGVQVRPITSAM